MKNRYFIACFVFLVYVSFFDSSSFLNQWEQKAELKTMTNLIESHKQKIEQTRKVLHELNTNPRYMETFAREQYRMKKDNEEVFIVISEKSE